MKKNIIPTRGGIIIPGIGNKIRRQLGKSGLKPEIDPFEFLEGKGKGRDRYYTSCADSDGNKLGFYAGVHNSQHVKNKMQREIFFLKEIGGREDLKAGKYVPRLISYGTGKGFDWFAREYADWHPLGKTDGLEIKLNARFIPTLIKMAKSINQIPVKFKTDIKLRWRSGSYKDYLYRTQKYAELLEKKMISEAEYKKIVDFILKNRELLDKENKYLAHGDFHPGNIIIGKNKCWIIDWELAQINNFALDITFFWLHTWETDNKFRKKLVLSYLESTPQKESFKKLFRLALIYLLAGELSFFLPPGRLAAERRRRRFNFFKKLLNCALTGFSSTIGAEPPKTA